MVFEEDIEEMEEVEDEELEEFEEVEEVEKPKKKVKKILKKKSKSEFDLNLEDINLVVKELPLQPVRKHKDKETGITTNFMTIEESLTQIQKDLSKLAGGL